MSAATASAAALSIPSITWLVVHRDRDRGVAEPLLHNLWSNPSSQCQRCPAVAPGVVWCQRRHSCLGGLLFRPSGEGGWVDRIADLVREHEIKTGPRIFMGRPRTTDEKRVTTAVRLPESMHERLTKEAETRDVSVNLLVTKAIDAYLDALVPVEELIATR